jgi:acylphosphatase
MSKMRAHLFVEGRVQGVFFRACTQEEAQERKLTGWVKNLYDGRVEAVFEGEEKDVQSMIEWCHSGPPHAMVVVVF